MDRLRLLLAWAVSVLWVIQMVANAIPGTGYDPSPYVHTAFGVVMTFLFGGAVLSHWKQNGKNRRNDDTNTDR